MAWIFLVCPVPNLIGMGWGSIGETIEGVGTASDRFTEFCTKYLYNCTKYLNVKQEPLATYDATPGARRGGADMVEAARG